MRAGLSVFGSFRRSAVLGVGAALLVLAGCGADTTNTYGPGIVTAAGAGGQTGGGGSGASSGCTQGLSACGTSCVNLASDIANCGECGSACGAGQVCVDGACTCSDGLVYCDGSCVDVQSNGSHCGGCNVACGDLVCADGVCQSSCPDGQTPCGTSCVDLASDIANCGECGNACVAGAACEAGRCVCQNGLTDCDGTCVDLLGSGTNCGACGNACAAGQTCSSGVCQDPAGGTGGTAGGSGGATGGSGGTAGGTGGSTGGTGGTTGGTGGTTGGTGGTTGGTGGTTGGTGPTGGSSGCPEPVNPNASQQARNLLCYLYEIYGNHVLSGQQEESWSYNNPSRIIEWYSQNFGKYPAVLGGDYLYPGDANQQAGGTSERAIAYWRAGGIPLIRYHMGAPPGSDTFDNSQGSADIEGVLTAGTQANNSFNSKLNYVAAELQQLENDNVAVLWAPFHEYQPGGWFWWSKGTAEQFQRLWRYMFDYLTNTKGLDNLVWLAPSSGSLSQDWFPGPEYADVAGPDTYETNPPFTALFSDALNVIGSSMPIALHETGTIPDPDTMFPSNAPWVLFNAWVGSSYPTNSTDSIREAYASEYTITRDEVPDLN
jgi:hypothetical protein